MWKRVRAQLVTQASPLQRLQMAAVLTAEFRRATSLPELAMALGISTSGLAATVAAYNHAADAGREDPARKTPSMCRPLRRGPYYGLDISVRPSLAYFVPGMTLGGLRVDGRSGQVLNEAGSPIRGLYAAGRTAVGICANSYVSGLSLADCVFSGIRAGEHAATSSVIGMYELGRGTTDVD
jgi:3-oxo-5alpha-steroid 4-dehydrogenase